MASKKTRGRQRVEMKTIENEGNKYASFSKRKTGLFKKAGDLCTRCKTNTGIMIFSPTGKPHSFFHPKEKKVVERFLMSNQPTNNADRFVDAMAQARIDRLNQQLDELEVQQKIEEQRAKKLDEVGAPEDKFGWLGVSVEETNIEMTKNLRSMISNSHVQLEEHAKELKELYSGASSSDTPTKTFVLLSVFCIH